MAQHEPWERAQLVLDSLFPFPLPHFNKPVFIILPPPSPLA